MFRRTSTSRISEFSMGHPNLSRHFGPILGRGIVAAKDAGVKTSTLPNGLRVVTHDKGQPVSTIGFYVEAGAKFDPTTSVPGLNHAFRYALLGGNMENTAFINDRSLRAYGTSFSHNEIRKRHIAWKAEVRRDSIAPIVNTFSAAIAAPRFADQEIERFKDTMDNELEELKFKQMHEYAATMLETVAFWKEPLGNPRFIAPQHTDNACSKNLLEQWASHMVPSRMILAGVNIDHDQLTSAYLSGAFPHSADAPHHARAEKITVSNDAEKRQFRAGAERDDVELLSAKTMHPDQKPDACVAMGWLTSGRDASLKDYATASIVHEILGMNVADSVSQIGQAAYHDGVRSFYNSFASAGLMGYTVKTTGDKIVDAVIAKSKLPAAVNADQLEGAKARALARMFSSELDMARDYADFLATSTFSVNDFSAALKTVTVADANKELTSMKSQDPAMFAVGHTVELPSLKTILAAQK